MKIIIDIPKARYKDIQRIASVQLENYHFKTAEQIIANGTPLPDGAEILTKDAYSDLCTRSAYVPNFESEEYVEDRIKNYDKMLKSGILDCVIEEVTGKRGTVNNEQTN